LRENQDTKKDPKNWQVSEVDFLPNQHLEKSAFEKHEEPKKKMWSTKG
jgi:hypothetical protein